MANRVLQRIQSGELISSVHDEIESLRHELADRGVGVTCVHPGGIRTRIAETARVASGVDEVEAAQRAET